jgi:hypothetical protein
MTASSTIPTTALSGTITNAQLANSTISGVALGGTLNTLTIGTGLSGTSYNGTGAVTIAIPSQGIGTGTVGSSTVIPVITYNDQGIITAVSQATSVALTYEGTWSAATNTPTLANGTGQQGNYYVCNAAGTVNFGAGPLVFNIGDWAIYSGTVWQQVNNSQTTSVANFTITGIPSGEILIGGGSSPITGTSTLDAASQISGTLPIATGGTNGSASPTAGTVAYGTGTAYGFTAAGTSGQVLTSAGAGTPTWTTPTTGTVTSVATAGTVNGLTLTGGTITTTGTITLGGTLDLSSPPAIGGTAPNSGAFTSLSASQNVTLSPGAGYTVTINPTDASSMDNVVIGANTPAAITGTVVTATSYFVGINGGSF